MSNLPILVVDDNEFIRASMVKFLQSNRYNVVGVSHAQDAMHELREGEFALVVTDVLMPDTDGFELVDYIRGYDEPMKSTPIIAISGGGRSVDASAVLGALEEKVELILKKPFSKQDLLDHVAVLMNKDGKTQNIS